MEIPTSNELHASIPVVILCGGTGTRLSQETRDLPKPLLPIGGLPILWRLMHIYGKQGFKRFVLCLGYKGESIKRYFLDWDVAHRDLELDLGTGERRFRDARPSNDWRVIFAETGLSTMTGARVKRIEHHIDSDVMMLTYADGLANIDLKALLDFHLAHGRIGTVTGVQPRSQFGALVTRGTQVCEFSEKPVVPALINGGFFVFNRAFFQYLDDDPNCILEREPLRRLAQDGEFEAYRHDGFWQCMDTFKDFTLLNELCEEKPPPWERF
jgi:glucose-1-phosphate cytidylyltransferase